MAIGKFSKTLVNAERLAARPPSRRHRDGPTLGDHDSGRHWRLL